MKYRRESTEIFVCWRCQKHFDISALDDTVFDSLCPECYGIVDQVDIFYLKERDDDNET